MAIGFTGPGWGDPWGLNRLRREMDDLIHRFGADASRGSDGTLYPPVNLYETGEEFVLTAELPGLRGEDFEVSVEGNKVTLRGERRIEIPRGEGTSLHRRERQTGVFRRTFALPTPADPDKTQAVYRHGVLMMRIAKAASHRPRRISVQAD